MALVKGANERNEFFEKINKQQCMTNKSGRTRQQNNNLRNELIWGWTPPGSKRLVYHCSNRTIELLSIFSMKKKKVLQSSMPCFCLFSYTVVNYIFECYRKRMSQRNEFNSIFFLRFCTKYNTWFSKYRIELIVALSSTNATKMKPGNIGICKSMLIRCKIN